MSGPLDQVGGKLQACRRPRMEGPQPEQGPSPPWILGGEQGAAGPGRSLDTGAEGRTVASGVGDPGRSGWQLSC